jgi:hypothetical protein
MAYNYDIIIPGFLAANDILIHLNITGKLLAALKVCAPSDFMETYPSGLIASQT